MKALVVVDMLNDFVDGALANPPRTADRRADRASAHPCSQRRLGRRLLQRRPPPEDPELTVWGEHAMAGTPGAQVIAELRRAARA